MTAGDERLVPEVEREMEAVERADSDGCFVPGCARPAEFLYAEAVNDPTAIEWPVCADHGRELVPWFDQAIADQDRAKGRADA